MADDPRRIKRILLYGGAFNPPHLGHERLLAAAMARVGPDLALVTPSPVSPHKHPAAVPLSVRALMCRCFKKLGGGVRISELERAGAHDKSYTVKTLARLRRRYRGAQIYLLIGGDMLLSFEEWHCFRRVLRMCTLLAAARTGSDGEGLEREARRLRRMGGRVEIMDFEPLETSSGEIRRRLAGGDDCAELLDPAVLETIKKYRLYGCEP